jgi:hypothetical protein
MMEQLQRGLPMKILTKRLRESASSLIVLKYQKLGEPEVPTWVCRRLLTQAKEENRARMFGNIITAVSFLEGQRAA